MLPAIEAALASETFGVVGLQFGVSGETIKNFLRRHGVDTAQYRKSVTIRYQRAKQEATKDDEWPAAVKPEKRIDLHTPAPEHREGGVKFDKVAMRDSWGNVRGRDVPASIGTETDPTTGATVKKYPPMYAHGAHPPRSIHVKGA